MDFEFFLHTSYHTLDELIDFYGEINNLLFRARSYTKSYPKIEDIAFHVKEEIGSIQEALSKEKEKGGY